MKNRLLPILISIVLLGLAVGYVVLQKQNPSANRDVSPDSSSAQSQDAALSTANGTYAVPDGSTVSWEGRKTLIAGWVDTGTLAVSEGSVTVRDGSVNGRFAFDMSTITSTSAMGKPEPSERLSTHLKSDAFFDVANHPTAEFILTGVTPTDGSDATTHTVTGDITIKGITHEIAFPAAITAEDGTLRFAAEVVLDRTLWDVRFGSGKFFENLADNVIDDLFTVRFDLVADRQ